MPPRGTAASAEHLVCYFAMEDIPDDWECVPPRQVREALRTISPHPSFPTETDDDPNYAEEISHDEDAAEPTDVEPDKSESPASSSLSAVLESPVSSGSPGGRCASDVSFCDLLVPVVWYTSRPHGAGDLKGKGWLKYFGPPDTLLSDRHWSSRARSSEVANTGVVSNIADAPQQNDRCERHGGRVKTQLGGELRTGDTVLFAPRHSSSAGVQDESSTAVRAPQGRQGHGRPSDAGR